VLLLWLQWFIWWINTDYNYLAVKITIMEDIKAVDTIKPLPKKAGGFKKFVRWFTFILLVVLLSFGYWKYYLTYSDGLQGGKMQKISKKGNIFKTWEGYLLITSATDNNTISLSNKEWDFSVTSDSLAHLLESFAEKRVILRYHQKNGTLPWRGDTEYIIYDVKLDQ
jgi:hypothetical protein